MNKKTKSPDWTKTVFCDKILRYDDICQVVLFSTHTIKLLKEGRMEKQNCWEYKKCGRESGGVNAFKEGVCPAAVVFELDGEHGGKNAGRACWVVVGTFNSKAKHGKFVDEKGCMACDFYLKVKAEEGCTFQLSATLRAAYQEKARKP